MKTIVVTGSAGLIGSEAAGHFAARGYQVVGVDNNMRRTFFGPDGDTTWQRQHLEETCRTYRHAEIDIRDREALAAALLRNAYAGEVPPETAERLADEALALDRRLDDLVLDDVVAGRLPWPRAAAEETQHEQA